MDKIDFVYLIAVDNITTKEDLTKITTLIEGNIKEKAPFNNNIYFVMDLNINLVNNHIYKSLKDIPNLTELFLVFDKPYLFTKKVSISDFFFNDMPKDMCTIKPYIPIEYDKSKYQLDIIGLLNSSYNKNQIINRNKKFFFNIKYGLKVIINNIVLNSFNFFIGFDNRVGPLPIKKEMIIKADRELMCYSKNLEFNNEEYVRLLRSLQIINLQFYPANYQILKKKIILGDITNGK